MWGFPEMGVPPKWMVYNGKHSIKMDDLGVPPFMENPMCRLIPVYNQTLDLQERLCGSLQNYDAFDDVKLTDSSMSKST